MLKCGSSFAVARMAVATVLYRLLFSLPFGVESRNGQAENRQTKEGDTPGTATTAVGGGTGVVGGTFAVAHDCTIG